jgi:ADP-ribose pyrophosphatase YjhB (NUDIX family)
MEQMIVNVEVVVVRDGRYLLGVRSEAEEYGAGWLTLPGGKLEANLEFQHALEITAQRELKEEVDLDVALDDLHYVESHTFFIENTPVLDVVMVTTNAHGEPHPVDDQELQSIAWLTEGEIATHPDVPAWTRASLAMAITYVATTNQ